MNSQNRANPARAPVIRLGLVIAVIVSLAVAGGFDLYLSRVRTRHRIENANATMDSESRRAPFRTLEYYDALDARNALLLQKPDGTAGKGAADDKAHDLAVELRGRAEVAEAAAAEKMFKDQDLNTEATRAIGEWRKQAAAGDPP